MTPNPMCVASFATVVCIMQGRWEAQKSRGVFIQDFGKLKGLILFLPASVYIPVGGRGRVPTALYASV